MGRKRREEEPWWIYHVVARGVVRRALFRDDGDCQVYLVILRGVVEVFGWRVYAYCLMGNHVHLLIQTPLPNLAEGMHRLHGHYARHFNNRYDVPGHVFEGRYRPTRVKTEGHLRAAIEYIANNPVDAGLCAQPGDWPRSSACSQPDGFIEVTAVA